MSVGGLSVLGGYCRSGKLTNAWPSAYSTSRRIELECLRWEEPRAINGYCKSAQGRTKDRDLCVVEAVFRLA